MLSDKVAAKIALKVVGALLHHVDEKGIAVRMEDECFAVYLNEDMIHIEETSDIADDAEFAFLDLRDN